MVEICQGAKSKNDVLAESIERYKEMFMKTKIEFQKLLQVRLVSRISNALVLTSYRLWAIVSTAKVLFLRLT